MIKIYNNILSPPLESYALPSAAAAAASQLPLWHGPEKTIAVLRGPAFSLLLFTYDVIQKDGRQTPESRPRNTGLFRAPASRPLNTRTPEDTFCVNVCVCVCVCVCVFSPMVYSGVLNTIKTSISGTLCNPGSVFRGLDKNWRLAILSPYRTVWQNFTKDPRIRWLYHLCLLMRDESGYSSAN